MGSQSSWPLLRDTSLVAGRSTYQTAKNSPSSQSTHFSADSYFCTFFESPMVLLQLIMQMRCEDFLVLYRLPRYPIWADFPWLLFQPKSIIHLDTLFYPSVPTIPMNIHPLPAVTHIFTDTIRREGLAWSWGFNTACLRLVKLPISVAALRPIAESQVRISTAQERLRWRKENLGFTQLARSSELFLSFFHIAIHMGGKEGKVRLTADIPPLKKRVLTPYLKSNSLPCSDSTM